LAGTPELKLVETAAALGSEAAFDLFARARRLEQGGREVIHLETGDSDFRTPPHILAAGIRALESRATACAPPAGLPELREVIAASAHARGLSVGPENVIVTSGSKPMIFYTLVALVESGTEALVPDPAYPIYEAAVRFARGRPVRYRVDPSLRGGLDPEEIARKISPRTRVLVLNTPHNPTGAVLPLATLGALANLVHRHGLTVVVDELYSRFVFDGLVPSIASLAGMADRTILVDGLSKTYAMTGWRLGYGIAPAELARKLERLIVNTTSCAPPFVQHAGVAALTGRQDSVRQMRDELRGRRDLLVAGLNGLEGVSCATPRGAFFAFPRISPLLEALDLTLERFTDRVLDDFGLACLPGTAFGPGGAGHLRLSFAASRPAIRRGLDLLGDAVRVCHPLHTIALPEARLSAVRHAAGVMR
jgi:aspartate aminotransferase